MIPLRISARPEISSQELMSKPPPALLPGSVQHNNSGKEETQKC